MAGKKPRTDRKDSWTVINEAFDPRVDWDREILKVLSHYRKNPKKLSLFKGLVMEFGGRPLREILPKVRPVDYQRDFGEARCICGEKLTAKLFRMDISGNSGKDGVEHHIHGRIKSKELISHMGHGSRTEFLVGSKCYEFLTELLSKMGEGYLKRISDVEKSRETKKKGLEGMLLNMPLSLREELAKEGIEWENVGRGLLIGTSKSTIQGLLYDLDPGKRNSFANWFREGIRNMSITHGEIIKMYHKMEDAPFTLSNSDLANLATYSYEFRRFDTRAVIGIEKDDLLYLNSLKDDDELVKTVGKPNIDKHYVRPATKFRKREGLEKTTIREKIGQSHMTFLEALGIKLHFPELESMREKANRQTSDKYGIGIGWNYIIKEIKPVFESDKTALHDEYMKFGEIVKEHVLTKEEYFIAKDFFERANIGEKTERENYLRMMSIRQFREIAPKITCMGRKIRMARKEYERSGNEWTWRDLIKQDYALKEDFNVPERTMEILAEQNIYGIRNKNLIRFQRDHGNMIKNAYDNGLIAKKYISDLKGENAFKRYSKLLEKEKVEEMDEKTSMNLEKIKKHVSSGIINYIGNDNAMDSSQRFISEKGRTRVGMLSTSIDVLMSMGKSDISKVDEIIKERNELKSKGEVLYIDKGSYNFVCFDDVSLERAKWDSKNFSFYRPDYVKMYLERLNNAVEMNGSFIEGLKEIENKHAILGLPGSYINQFDWKAKGKKIFASKGLIYAVNRLDDLYHR